MRETKTEYREQFGGVQGFFFFFFKAAAAGEMSATFFGQREQQESSGLKAPKKAKGRKLVWTRPHAREGRHLFFCCAELPCTDKRLQPFLKKQNI